MRRASISDLVDRPADLESVYRIFIRDLEIAWTPTSDPATDGGLMVSVDIVADRPTPANADRYRNVVCYDTVVRAAKTLAADPLVRTIEALAERIGAQCLGDARVRTAAVRITPRTGHHAGVELVRRRAILGRETTMVRAVGRG